MANLIEKQSPRGRRVNQIFQNPNGNGEIEQLTPRGERLNQYWVIDLEELGTLLHINAIYPTGSLADNYGTNLVTIINNIYNAMLDLNNTIWQTALTYNSYPCTNSGLACNQHKITQYDIRTVSINSQVLEDTINNWVEWMNTLNSVMTGWVGEGLCVSFIAGMPPITTTETTSIYIMIDNLIAHMHNTQNIAEQNLTIAGSVVCIPVFDIFGNLICYRC